MTTRRLPWGPTAALGVLSIVAFGAWFYGYGVLIDPIRADTGWSESLLGGTYGAAFLVAGAGGTAVGHWLDQRGSRATFLWLAVGATVALLAASWPRPRGGSRSPVPSAGAWSVPGGTTRRPRP